MRRAWPVAALSVLIAGVYLTAADPAEVVLYASRASIVGNGWGVVADASAAAGSRVASPNLGAAKAASANPAPSSYFELTFSAAAGSGYRLWVRGKAASNYWGNDSVFVQFSDSVDGAGNPMFRIGSASAAMVNLEDCSGCGISGWGWQDNGYGSGVLGPLIYFQNSGPHTLRVQVREDGFSIDQIVLSPVTYLSRSPGALRADATILPEADGSGTGATVTVVRQPYLQQVTNASAVVVWASREPGPAEVRYGVAGGTVSTAPAASTLFPASATGMAFDYYQHEARLNGLTAATAYLYDVVLNGAKVFSTSDRLVTAPSSGTGTVRFLVFGDSGTGSAAQRQLASRMAGEVYDTIFHTGDVAYGNTGGTGGGSYLQLHDWFFDIYRALLRGHPAYPSLGNHDDRVNYGQAYRDLFVLPENGASATYPDHAERYYSFDYGPVHLVVLDTERAFQETARRQAQIDWLDADLAATRQPWKIAVFHRSPYSSGGEHGSDLAVRNAFGPVFERRGVQVALSGHEHDYERSVPWRTSTDAALQAVTYVVTGGGGAPLYPAGQREWTARSASVYHYVRAAASGCRISLDTVGSDGLAIDSFFVDRCMQESDGAAPVVALATPSPGAAVAGAVQVTADATDDTRVEKVDFWVDGALAHIDLTAPYGFAWDTTRVADGSHTIEARAYDHAGRRATSGAQAVQVANASNLPDIVLYAASAPVRVGAWSVMSDTTAAGGARLWNPDRGAVKLTAPLATPAAYFEVSFEAEAGRPYRLWLRGKAENNYWGNDSVFAQFSGSVSDGGAPVYRIGTTAGTSVNIEDCSGCGLSGWGWQDNGWGTGVLGPLIYFERTGAQTLRIQPREDGLSIDQIVLSPSRFLSAAPGGTKGDATILP